MATGRNFDLKKIGNLIVIRFWLSLEIQDGSCANIWFFKGMNSWCENILATWKQSESKKMISCIYGELSKEIERRVFFEKKIINFDFVPSLTC